MAERDLEDLVKRFQAFEVAVIQAAPGITAEVAQGVLAQVINRIHKQGISVEGRKFQYSTNPMLATKKQFHNTAAFKQSEVANELGRKKGKLVPGGVRNKAGQIKSSKSAKKKYLWIRFPGASKAVPVMILRGGYRQLRQIQGDESGYVNLTYTARMFQNTKIIQYIREGFKFTALIGATQAEERKKLYYNSVRYGNFLAPELKEIEVVQEIPAKRILDIALKIFT